MNHISSCSVMRTLFLFIYIITVESTQLCRLGEKDASASLSVQVSGSPSIHYAHSTRTSTSPTLTTTTTTAHAQQIEGKTYSITSTSDPEDVVKLACQSFEENKDPEHFVECALFVRARIYQEQNLEMNTELNECLDMACPDIIGSTTSAVISVELPGSRALVLDSEGIGRLQRRTLTRCGSWRSGSTLLASAALSLYEGKMPIWIEISSSSTSPSGDVTHSNDDVAYFTMLAARFDASVHVFEPDVTRILNILETTKQNSQEDSVTIHPMYMSSNSSSISKPGVHLCTAEEQCEANVFATRTTLDRTMLPVLYRYKGASRRRGVAWIHLRVRNYEEIMNVFRGMRKLLGLRWIDTILIDRRGSSSSSSSSNSIFSQVTRTLGESGFVTLCLDNTTLASDIGEVFTEDLDVLLQDLNTRFISSSCDSILASRSETFLLRTLKRASEMLRHEEKKKKKLRRRKESSTTKYNTVEQIEIIDREAKLAADSFRSGKGHVWLQRVRNAGGSMLCHNLRLNSDLLLNTSSIVRFGDVTTSTSSSSLQLVDFSKSYEDYCHSSTSSSSSSKYHHLTQDEEENDQNDDDCCQIESHDMNDVKGFIKNLGERNIVEESIRPLPVSSLLRHREEWSRWVFVTSLRGPLDRAMSLFHSEPRYCRDEFQVGKPCSYSDLFRDDVVRKNCAEASYCYSNHFTRVFSGRHGTDELSREDLEIAKIMLHRFSCILILESLNRTSSCLDHTLGLSSLELNHREYTDNMFNNVKETLSPPNLKRLMELNEFDLELWEYALSLLHSRGYYSHGDSVVLEE